MDADTFRARALVSLMFLNARRERTHDKEIDENVEIFDKAGDRGRHHAAGP